MLLSSSWMRTSTKLTRIEVNILYHLDVFNPLVIGIPIVCTMPRMLGKTDQSQQPVALLSPVFLSGCGEQCSRHQCSRRSYYCGPSRVLSGLAGDHGGLSGSTEATIGDLIGNGE